MKTIIKNTYDALKLLEDALTDIRTQVPRMPDEYITLSKIIDELCILKLHIGRQHHFAKTKEDQ